MESKMPFIFNKLNLSRTIETRDAERGLILLYSSMHSYLYNMDTAFLYT